MNETPKSIALIISTGEQDVKLWKEPKPSNPPLRKEAEIIKGRELQAALLRTGAYRLLLPRELRDEPDVRPIELGEQGPRSQSAPKLLPDLLLTLCRNKTKGCVLEDHCGNLLLRPAKIENLISTLDKQRAQQEIVVTHVLVFATDRMTPEQFEERWRPEDEAGKERLSTHEDRYRKEPYAYGAILARWLGDRFGLAGTAAEYHPRADSEIPPACWVNIMKDLPSFEGEPGTIDHPLDRSLARRIDDAIDALARASDGYAIVSSTGGSCDAKACILASAHLRFPDRVYDYPETEEGGRFTLDDLDRQESDIGPTLSMIARAPCATLIRRGDPLGAWGAVAHLMPTDSEKAQPWLRKVRDLERFFRGDLGIDQVLSGANDLAAIPGFGKLLQIAFSVEAALEGREDDRRISEAVTGVGAFIEQAILVVLARAIPSLLGGNYALDLENECLQSASGGEVAKDDRSALLAIIRCDLRNRDLEGSMRNDLLGDTASRSSVKVFGNNADCWRHWLCAQSKEPWKSAGAQLERFEQYRRNPSSAPNLRTFRNRSAHGTLRPEDVQEVKRLAGRSSVCATEPPFKGKTIAGPLWSLAGGAFAAASPENQQFGRRFLASPPTVAVFECIREVFECGLAGNPAALYDRMIRDVLDALHAPIDLA